MMDKKYSSIQREGLLWRWSRKGSRSMETWLFLYFLITDCAGKKKKSFISESNYSDILLLRILRVFSRCHHQQGAIERTVCSVSCLHVVCRVYVSCLHVVCRVYSSLLCAFRPTLPVSAKRALAYTIGLRWRMRCDFLQTCPHCKLNSKLW